MNKFSNKQVVAFCNKGILCLENEGNNRVDRRYMWSCTVISLMHVPLSRKEPIPKSTFYRAYLKRKARIVEGGITRVEKNEANILLKSSEIILCISGLYHILKGWKGHESPVNLSDIRLFIPA